MSPPIAHVSITVTAIGLLLQAGLAVAYVTAAMRPSPRGHRWPLRRTVSFLAGLTLFALAVGPPVAAEDELLWVHAAQHLVVMMAVPPLLVLGAPLTLLLRTVSPRARHEIVAVMKDPAMKATSGRRAGIALTVEYHATMFLVLLTPLYGWSIAHESVHVAVHAYLLTCGLLFWMPLAGKDPAAWRPSFRTKLWVVAAGIPANVVLGLLVASRSDPLGGVGSLGDTQAGGWVLAAGGIALTLAGLALLVARQRAGRRSGPRLRWKARRMFAISKAMATQQATDQQQ